jgi:hypothetical protein
MSDSRKKNVFCMGSDKLAIVLDKIESSGVKVQAHRGYWKESTCAFAYSPTYDDGRICYSSNRSFYEAEHNYVEVTPETFSEIWLGYNCLKEETIIKKKQTFKIKL